MTQNRFHLNRWTGLFVALGMFVLAGARAEQPAESGADPIKPLIESVGELIRTLDEHGLFFDAATARLRVIDTLLKVADPLAEVVDGERVEAMKRTADGYVYETGIRIERTNAVLRVAAVEPGSAAEQAGVKTGDEIVEVAGIPASITGMHRLILMMRAAEEKPLSLRVVSDRTTNLVTVARTERRLTPIERAESWPAKLCYVNVNGLYDGSGRELTRKLRDSMENGCFGVVLDVRGAGGSDLDSVEQIADLFAPKGTMLFAYRDKDDQDLDVRSAASDDVLDMPLMLLVDEETSGASEVLAAVLADSGRGAMLLGQTTGGDLMVRDVMVLPEGEQVWLTTRRLVVGDGTVYNGQEGVRPDVVVMRRDWDPVEIAARRNHGKEITPEEIDNQTLIYLTHGDNALRRAVDVLLGLKALNIKGLGSSL